MQINRKSLLSGAENASNISVVIDVFRAFTCSAIMYRLGLKNLILMADPEEVLSLKKASKEYLAIGEVKGRKYPGFDAGNSPSKLMSLGESFFNGKTAVFRTSAGTRGVIAASKNSKLVILGSYVTAMAITQYLRRLDDSEGPINIIAMGSEGEKKSPEDEFCADYIESLLTGSKYDHLDAVWSIINAPFTQKNLRGGRPHFPEEDVILCLQKNIFDFVLLAKKEGNHVVVTKVDVL